MPRIVTTCLLLSAGLTLASVADAATTAEQLAEWRELAVQNPAAVPSQPAPAILALADSTAGEARAQIAHRLRQARYYEETLAWSDAIKADQLASGPQLLFDRAVAQHALVQPEAALKTVAELRKLPGKLPRRYEELAKLIERSATRTVKTPLRGISQQMGDVDRRLELGRTGEPEIALEQTVLDELDKLINKLQEQQNQQQQQQQVASAAATPSASPPQDSQPGEFKGPGKVAPRRLAAGGEWGSLPPAERARVTQQLSRDFPAHYRELIEAYYKQLAEQPAPTEREEEP
jgi:hypothetical protein